MDYENTLETHVTIFLTIVRANLLQQGRWCWWIRRTGKFAAIETKNWLADTLAPVRDRDAGGHHARRCRSRKYFMWPDHAGSVRRPTGFSSARHRRSMSTGPAGKSESNIFYKGHKGSTARLVSNGHPTSTRGSGHRPRLLARQHRQPSFGGTYDIYFYF